MILESIASKLEGVGDPDIFAEVLAIGRPSPWLQIPSMGPLPDGLPMTVFGENAFVYTFSFRHDYSGGSVVVLKEVPNGIGYMLKVLFDLPFFSH